MNFQFQSSLGFQIKTFSVGQLQCNCSLVWDPESMEAIVVDPGDEALRIQKEIVDLGLKVRHIVHTHAHFDHVSAAREVHQFTKAPLLLHPDDKYLWENVAMQGQFFRIHVDPLPPWSENLEHEKALQIGKYRMKTLFTPGHTPGSCCFSMNEILFSGDTLFQGSVGRTDLWGGDFRQISSSIKDRLYTLDTDTTVICGHGANTQIGIEAKQNAFVKK
ncbi:MAG: MBL fold metallo-hydrolase [Deltaproteobacteria bacterium]|nr:MBL fold metallo-hydrolase [Deltaproteobacteria bacterium]